MAATEARGLVIDLGANVVQFKRDMADASRVTNQTVDSITSKIKGIGAAFAGIGAGLALGTIIQKAGEAEKNLAQLNATLKSTGGAAGFSSKQLTDYADSLRKVTSYDDDAIAGAESLLLTFTKIKGQNFKDATKSILDLAAKTGGDLNSAAILVGKSLQDPIRGIEALHKKGVGLSQAQQELVKSFVNTGQAAKAQEVILQGLQTAYGGSAEAARHTLTGALDAMKVSIDNVLEGIGQSQSTGLQFVFNSVGGVMDELADHSKELSNALLGIAAAAAIMQAAKLPAVFSQIGTSVTTLIGNLAGGGLTGVLLASTAAIVALGITFKDTNFKIGSSAVTLQTLLIATWEKTSEAIGKIIDAIKPYFDAMAKWASDTAKMIAKVFSDTFANIGKFLGAIFDALEKIPLFAGLAKGAKQAIAGIQQLGNEIKKNVIDPAFKFGDSIVKRAAELNKPKAATDTGIGHLAADDNDISKEAQKKLAAFAKFIEARRAENRELQAELDGNKAMVPFLKAQAEIESQIGKLSKEQLATLKQVMAEHQSLVASGALKAQLDGLKLQSKELDLQLQNRKDEIPYEQFLNQLREKGVDLSTLDAKQSEQLLAIKQKLLEIEQKKADLVTNNQITANNEQLKQAADQLNLTKNQAELEAVIRKALVDNENISDAQLNTLIEQTKQKQKIADLTAAKDSLKDLKDQTSQLMEQRHWQELILKGGMEQARYEQLIFDKQKGMTRELTAAERSQLKQIAHEQTINEELTRRNQLLDGLKTEAQKFADLQQEVAKLMKDTGLSAQQAQQILNNANPALQKFKQTAAEVGKAFETAFDSMILKGGKFSDVLKQLGLDLLHIAEQKLIFAPLEAGFSKLLERLMGGGSGGGGSGSGGFNGSGSGFGAGIKDLLHKAHVPGFARGGRPQPGQFYMVGEDGPELRIDDAPGTIFNNDFYSAFDDFFGFGSSLGDLGGSDAMAQMMMGGGKRRQDIGMGFASGGANGGGFGGGQTLRDVNTEAAIMYNNRAAQYQSQGLMLASNLNTAMARRMEAANGPYMYSGFADPTLFVDHAVNMDPTIQAFHPLGTAGEVSAMLGGGGMPDFNFGPYDHGADFIPGFMGGILGSDNARRYNGGGDPLHQISGKLAYNSADYGPSKNGWGSFPPNRRWDRMFEQNVTDGPGGIGAPAENPGYRAKHWKAGSQHPPDSYYLNFGGQHNGEGNDNLFRQSPFSMAKFGEWGALPGLLQGFANGGRPPINRPSWVGERGKELFVPDTAGTIIPNNKIGGQPEMKVEIHDHAGLPITQQVVNTPGGGRAMKYTIAEEIANDMKVLGPIYQAFSKNLGVKKKAVGR